MLDFRPHKLQAVNFINGGKNEDGEPIPDTEEVEEMPCRIVPNGSASQITFDDGVAHDYSFTIYLDQDCRTFSAGEIVRLFGLDGQQENGRELKVLGFHRYQLNARVWV